MFEFLQFIRSRQDRLFQILLSLFLAVVIYLNAEAGRLMGVGMGPLLISPVWPATGFSLAALLLFGPKVWPGIFLGNFVYNTTHFFAGSEGALAPLVAGTAISVGSLLEALVGWYIIHRFSTSVHLRSVKDVVIFLIGGGILTCTIASSIGVITLYAYGVLPSDYVFTTWLTFWLGDTLGVYAFTPFLIVWSVHKVKKSAIKLLSWEVLAMAIAFLAVTWSSLVHTYPITDLFSPLSVWVAYRTGLHGTVLLNILIALTSTILTSIGKGCLVAYFPNSSMLVLVGFVEIIIATALIVAAMITEKESSRF